MDYDTWAARKAAGTAKSAKSKDRSARRDSVIEVFAVFPDDWFNTNSLSAFLDMYVDKNMLRDLANKGTLTAGPYVPGSPIPRYYKFSS